MNVYDKAHELAQALERSDDYQYYKQAKKILQNDEKNYEMYKKFCRMQWEVQLAEAKGENVDPAKKQKLEETYKLINYNPTINEYLNAEYRLVTLINDIQKILAQAMPEWTEDDNNLCERTDGEE